MTSQKLFALSLGFGALIMAAQHALAAPPQCGLRDRVLAIIAQTYGETRRSVFLEGENALVEVFASDASGSWTITATLPDGRMCLVASGHGYRSGDETPLAAGKPA